VINKPVVVLSPRFLSENERAVIAHEHDRGTTVRATAMLLGRSPSTVSRELRRNNDPAGVYRPALAHRLARDRRRRHRLRRLACDGVLREFVQQRLDVRWTPEQIAATLRLEWPDDPRRQLSKESLYQALYTHDTVLVRNLRTGRHQRRPQQRGDTRRPRGLPQPMRSIEERPTHVADRVEAGHFEGDLIMGASNRTAIATLVERSSRNVTLVRVGANRTAAGLCASLVDVFTAMPPGLARSLTWDQGKEMACHLELSSATGMPVYFCRRSSPWQRGSNENMNGLLRQYFPKGSDLSMHGDEHLALVAAELNARPRKTLGWRTPADVLATLQNRPGTPTGSTPPTLPAVFEPVPPCTCDSD